MDKKKSSTLLVGFLCCLLAAGVGIEATGNQAPKPEASQTIQVSQNVKLEVEGKDFVPKSNSGRELPVFLYDGAAYAPVRALAERLHYSVDYSSKDRTVRMEPSPRPEEVEKELLEQNLEKRMELVKTIEFRDQEGNSAVVDALADPDPDDACFSWLHRLRYYRKVISENGEKPEDYQGSGIDVVFLDEEGDCVCKYEDVSEHYMTYLGDYYTNEYLDILDIERIRRVLAGKPQEFEPEKLFDIGQADWIILDGGDRGKTVKIDDPETIAALTDLFNSVECRREDSYLGWAGCGLTFTWYKDSGEMVESIGVNSGTTLKYDKFFRSVTSDPLDMDWFGRLLDKFPQADWRDKFPIKALPGALDAQYLWIENGTGAIMADVSDPELVKRLGENIGNIRFQVGERVPGSAWDKADDGRCFVQWLAVDKEGNLTHAEVTVCVLDEKTIAFGGDQGYYATAMDGKTIDKQLLDDLLNQEGPYKDNPKVLYRELSEEE